MFRILCATAAILALGMTSLIAAPAISGTSINSGNTQGGYTMTITGTDFGTASDPATVEIGSYTGVSSSVVSSVEITTTVPAGQGILLPIQITTLTGTAIAGSTFSYDPPTITSVTGAGSHPTSGGNTVTINGSNFGLTGQTVTINGNPGAVLTSDHASATVTAPAGVGANQPVILSVGGQSSTPDGFSIYSYDPPNIVSVSPNTGPQIGGTSITITGSNFGPNGAGQTVFFGGNSATINSADHTSFTVTLPAGGSLGIVDVTLTASGQSDTVVGGFEYDVVPVELSVFTHE